MRKLKLLIFPCIAMILLSCGHNAYFEENLEISENGWSRDSLAKFRFSVEDTTTMYDVYVHVRNTGDYPYSNMYLFINWFGPDSVFMRDTFECKLADPTGRWYGKGSAGLYMHEIPLHEGIFFPRAGQYEIQYEQAMRDEVLHEITDIGLRLEKHEQQEK